MSSGLNHHPICEFLESLLLVCRYHGLYAILDLTIQDLVEVIVLFDSVVTKRIENNYQRLQHLIMLRAFMKNELDYCDYD